MKKNSNDFQIAHDWAYERVEMIQVNANRWQLAFWVSLAGLFFAMFAITEMMPMKTVEPIIIQKDLQTGEVFVSPGEPANLTKTPKEIESDVVRYVVARESYSLMDEEVRFRQVQYMSGRDAFSHYAEEARNTNPESLEARLGHKGIRKVTIEDVIFLDPSNAKIKVAMQPIVKVDFTTTENNGQMTSKHYWVATIEFKYLGTPDTKEAAWANWDGFTVMDYRIDQRNVN